MLYCKISLNLPFKCGYQRSNITYLVFIVTFIEVKSFKNSFIVQRFSLIISARRESKI